MTAAANLDFLNLTFLTVETIKIVKQRHRANFRLNESIFIRDMAIFRFFKMADDAILD